MTSPDDVATICPGCGRAMEPEHAHYRCRFCGYRDTCCDGAPAPAVCVSAQERLPAQECLPAQG